MTKNLPPTAETSTPTSAALKFVQKSNSQLANHSDGNHNTPSSEDATRRKRRQSPKQPRKVKPTYQSFSTRIRSDLKRRLKRLSHEREEQDAEIKSVQQFVEEAVLMWLDEQEGVS
ncbi:MAG: hypothetical protein KDB27_14700 [Planctomycetales bacterium]|nr:hypothetical protein [Planctomycetales bacterium]